MSENVTTESITSDAGSPNGVPFTVLTDWSGPAWAESWRLENENICWTRRPHITAFRRGGVELGEKVGRAAELEAEAYDWFGVSPTGAVRVERETEATIVIEGEPYSPAEARKLAAAILGLCDAVDGVS